jgi:outer membrane lipoprotein-sorting protein
MSMNWMRSWRGIGLGVGLAALAPHAAADRAKPAVEAKATPADLSLDAIVTRHLAALGGADVLRATKSMSYVVSGEKAGKKFTKSVHYARPGKMRVDFETEEGKGAKGFDGKVAWVKKPGEAAVAMPAEDTAMMKSHADFDEPLLDHARRGIGVKLIGKSEVAGTPAYELEIAKGGEVERHFIDAATFLPLQRTWTAKKDGKSVAMAVRFGDFRRVSGRAINHSIEFLADGVTSKSFVSQVAFDKPLDASLFSLPKK